MSEENRKQAYEKALAARDFFLCVTATDFAEFWREFAGEELSDPDALEFEFNRLFVGPASPVAPPYASVYLEKEPRLMGESTLEIRELYKALGLRAPDGVPDDFLPYELEAWLTLESMEDAQAARAWLRARLLTWMPLFLNKLNGAPLSPQTRAVARSLAEWLSAVRK